MTLDSLFKGLLFATVLLLGQTGTAFATAYTVVRETSTLTFAGTHAEKPFTGTIGSWDAEIVFDPNSLETSHIKATFDLSSLKTGDSLYDGTLPQADWFDVANHPTGLFTSERITHTGGNVYKIAGSLTLRGRAQPVTFDATIVPLDATPVTATASWTIDRLAFGIGQSSDPEAEWVSREITLTLVLKATKTPENTNIITMKK